MKNNGYGVRDFIIENFLYGDASQLQKETSFLGNSIIDSTGILELVAFLEEKYGIIISDEEILPANLDSLNNIELFISRKLNGSKTWEPEVCVSYPNQPRTSPASQDQAVIATEPDPAL
jgi:acyl carrier protein